jgi:hypothetical protein
MYPQYHFLFGLIFIFILKLLAPFFSLTEILIIFLASFLIDSDHYFYYVFKKKGLSITDAYAWFIDLNEKTKPLPKEERRTYKSPLFIFHVFEFWIILAALSFLNKIFLLILIGFLFHILIDYLDLIIHKEPLYPKLSLIYTLMKNKGKKELI